MLWSRRTWLGSAAAALSANEGPVRREPLRPRTFGPLYYDESTWALLSEVLKTRSPFRFWGMGATPPDKVARLERTVAQWMGVKYALAVNSGTSALETALAALEIGPGDEVIVPAWTWHSCWHAVVRMGALPVTAEVDGSFNLDPTLVERHITPATRAIMIVHLQGNPADLGKLLPIARKHNLKVLEDCSQAVGASYQGKPLGSYGDIAAASLQVNKTISAGEGGIVYTNDPLLFERSVRFHDVGTLRQVHEEMLGQKPVLDAFPGANFRMNEFSGAVLLSQFQQLTQVVSDIRGVARRVYDGVRDLPGIRFRHLPDPAGELGVGVYMEFESQSKRDRFLTLMKGENIPGSPPSGSAVLPIQPYALHKTGCGKNWPSFILGRGSSIQYGKDSCPRTLDVMARYGGINLDPKYSEADTRDVVAAIRKVWPKVAG
jgi:8-amino-3,8-dideoxy-alpha-D-manno-octulosonate transaminase